MPQPELVLDLSVDGLSLWQPAEARDWSLLGFASLDAPDLPAKITAMRAAAVAAAGADFATMLLLPDDHIWVQHLHLHGLTANALDASARRALAEATSLPLTGFSLAFGDTGPGGKTAVAATTTEVLDEARKFARDNGFNPKSIAARSFFEGFSTRPVFGDAPKPLAFLPRPAKPQAHAAEKPSRPPAVPFVWPKLPVIPRNWALGGAAAATLALATTWWAIDPYEQFLRPPRALADIDGQALPDALPSVAPLPAALLRQEPGQLAPEMRAAEVPAAIVLSGLATPATAGGTQVAVNFSPEGVYFAEVPTPPKAPSGLGGVVSWVAPAAMFLETPDEEPSLGVAAMQKLPELALAAAAPLDSGILQGVQVSAVSTRAVGTLAVIGLETAPPLPATELGEFAYRDAASVLSEAQALQIAAGTVELLPQELPDLSAETLELAALSGPFAPDPAADILMETPQSPLSAPGTRPQARPQSLAVITPSEAAAALTPAAEAGFIGPVWPGPEQPRSYQGVEFVAGRPGHVRPLARPATDAPVPDLLASATATLPAGVTAFDPANSAHVRPLPRSAELMAKVAEETAAANAEASILALNLPPSAAIDIGLGWQEYNPDSPVHVRPRLRPASLQQLAEQGDLSPTALALTASIRPAVRPISIAAIMQARADEIARAQSAAADAEARAQSVAEATALALSEAQGETATTTAEIDPDLAALDDAEPESDVQVASLPTSADVAEAATTDGDLRRGEFNLIGIYGTASKRRALVRLPSGRYERVTVGDTFSGWRVAAISDDAIRITKGSAEEILRMPD